MCRAAPIFGAVSFLVHGEELAKTSQDAEGEVIPLEFNLAGQKMLLNGVRVVSTEFLIGATKLTKTIPLELR